MAMPLDPVHVRQSVINGAPAATRSPLATEIAVTRPSKGAVRISLSLIDPISSSIALGTALTTSPGAAPHPRVGAFLCAGWATAKGKLKLSTLHRLRDNDFSLKETSRKTHESARA
jgi:hypothetical protein